jgi:hypothetical protein
VVIDFAVVNPSRRILTAVKMLVEVTETGRLIPSCTINTMRIRRFFEADSLESWSEVALLVLVLCLTTWRLSTTFARHCGQLWAWLCRQRQRRSNQVAPDPASHPIDAPCTQGLRHGDPIHAKKCTPPPRSADATSEQAGEEALKRRLRMHGERGVSI